MYEEERTPHRKTKTSPKRAAALCCGWQNKNRTALTYKVRAEACAPASTGSSMGHTRTSLSHDRLGAEARSIGHKLWPEGHDIAKRGACPLFGSILEFFFALLSHTAVCCCFCSETITKLFADSRQHNAGATEIARFRSPSGWLCAYAPSNWAMQHSHLISFWLASR